MANKNEAPAQVVLDPTMEALKAELERMKKENAQLKQVKRASGAFSMKVSEKGAISIYGLGRFPVTLYQEQWAKLIGTGETLENGQMDLGHVLEIQAFIKAELAKGTLKTDPDAVAASKKEAAARTAEALKKLPPKK